MIHKILDILRESTAQFLARLPELNVTTDSIVVLSPLVKPDCSSAMPDNCLAMTLVNVEEERVMKAQAAVSIDQNGRVSHRQPEIRLNLYVVVTSHFTNYKTALEYLSAAMRFFQSKNVFTTEDTPGLDPSVGKLVVELYSLDFEQLNHLWATIGGKYEPSVMYRIKMAVLQEDHKTDEQPPITTINISDRSK